MFSEQLPLLGLCAAVIALTAGGIYFVVSRRKARQRQQRDAVWRELCLRLELVPEPRDGKVAAGQQQDTNFSLRDTGSDWILELPLPHPLLPSGVVLLSPKARGLRPRFKLLPLHWEPPLAAPRGLVWYQNQEMLPSKVEASQAFLVEARRAEETHSPLRVEPRRHAHVLRAGTQLSVNDVREAVRAVEATSRQWLEVVTLHGLPTVTALPRLPSALSILWGVVARRSPRNWLLAINVGIPVTLGALLLGQRGLFFVLLAAAVIATLRASGKTRYGLKGLVLGALVLTSTFAAPWFWARSPRRATSPAVLSVRDAGALPHRKAELFRFNDAVVRTDLGTPDGSRLVPVVSANWQPDEQVTVLAMRLPPKDQGYGTLGGVAVEPPYRYRSEALNLALGHKFALHPHYRMVDFSSHPDEEKTSQQFLAFSLWGLPNALWLGGVLVMWRREFRRSRRNREEGSSENASEE